MTGVRTLIICFIFASFIHAAKAQDHKKANMLKSLANENYEQKKYKAAIKNYEEYIRIEKSLNDPDIDGIAEVEFQMAQSYEMIGDYLTAIKQFDALIDFYLEKKNVPKIKKLINLIAADFTEITNKNISINFPDSTLEKQILYFRIERVTNHHGRNYTATIKGGSNDGIFINSKGILRGVYKKSSDRNILLGNAEAIEVNPNYSTVNIVISDTVDTEKSPRKGDIVSLTVNIPKKYRSIFFDLALLNVSFLTNEKDLFFHLRHLIYFDRPALEDAISMAMANDVKETIEYIDGLKDDQYANLNNPLKSGFYKNRSVVTVMKQINKNDIHAFMAFVKGFPGKYMGTDYRIDETFATWILNAAPISAQMALDSLLTAKTDSKMSYYLKICKDDSYSDKFVYDWKDIANSLSSKGFLDSAFKVNALSIKYALFIFDKKQLGYSFYNKAQLLRDAGKYEQSNETYDKALKIFIEINDIEMQAKCINNEALNLVSLNRYQNAIPKFIESLNVKYKNLKATTSPDQFESIANTLWGIGYANFKLGNYNDAREIYEKALAYYDTANSAFETKAFIYKKLGEIFNKTGDYKKAIERYQNARALYSQTAKVKEEANAVDEIAYNYSKSGENNIALKNYEEAYNLHLKANDMSNAAFSMSNIGQIKWNKGDYPGAIKAHEESVKIKKEIDDSSGLAYSYSKLGDLFKESGEPLKAKSYYEDALAIYKTLNDSSSVAEMLNTLGDLFYNLQDYAKSIDYYTNSLDIREKLKGKKEIAESYYNLAYSYFKIKEYSKAKDFQTKSLRLRKLIDDKSGQLYSLSQLGIIAQYFDHDFVSAEKFITEALSVAKQLQSKSYYAFCFSNLGNLYNAKGDLNKSGLFLDSALFYYKEIDDKSGISSILNDIGFLNISRGNFTKAVDLYNQALKLAQETNNKNGEATAYLSLGDYNNLIGDFKKALEYNNKALDIYKLSDNSWGIASVFINMGNTYNYMGLYQVAMLNYNKSDSIYITLKDEFSRMTPVNNIGTIYFYQGDYKNALIKFSTAYEVLDKIKYDGEFMITAKWNLGENYFEDRVYPEAEKWLTEALDLAVKSDNQRKIPGVSITLGKLRLAQKKYPEALKLLTDGYLGNVKFGEKERIIEAASFLGKLYFETNDLKNAKKFLNESINLSKEIGSTKYLWEPLYSMSLINIAEKDTLAAINLLIEAVDVIEGIKQNVAGGEFEKKFFSKSGPKVRIYELLVSELIKQHKIKEAFYYQERANIEGLKEQTRGEDTRGADVITDQTNTQDLQLKIGGIYDQLIKEKSKPIGQQNPEKIKSLENLMTVAQNDYISFTDSVITQDDNLSKNFSSNINPKDLDDARMDLPDDAAVVEYLLTEDKIIIFVATNKLLEAKVIEVKKAEFEQFISSFYNQIISKSDETKLKTNSEQLYTILINPILNEIKDIKRLAIIPTGKLFKIPFQAIGKTQPDKKFRYLIEDYSIYYINNIKFVYGSNSQVAPDIRIVAFGNADGSLKFAESEVNNIKKIFPTTVVYTQQAATEDIAKQDIVKFSYIHFATHGNLDPFIFKNSYLTLAPDVSKGEDGRFTINEISTIKSLRNCQLITLSACNTAVNVEKVEGWINNPAKEFLQKGAKSVVASLWMVDDLATGSLMEQFYTNLKNSETKVDALKNAQIKLLKTPGFSHPYYWAPFELIGEWK